MAREKVDKKLKDEISRLENLMSNEEKKEQRLAKTTELIKIANELRGLELEVAKHAISFQGLKDTLNTKTIETGLTMTTDNILLSKAIPPLYPLKPNKKLVIILFAILFLLSV